MSLTEKQSLGLRYHPSCGQAYIRVGPAAATLK
jgi:hypothetical protein